MVPSLVNMGRDSNNLAAATLRAVLLPFAMLSRFLPRDQYAMYALMLLPVVLVRPRFVCSSSVCLVLVRPRFERAPWMGACGSN